MPTRKEGYNRGGSRGTHPNQQNMTSCAHSSCRNNRAPRLRCPLDSVVRRHGMGELCSEGRSPFTICCSKLMFPWMNPKATDTKESGKHRHVFFVLLSNLFLRYIVLRKANCCVILCTAFIPFYNIAFFTSYSLFSF